MTEHDSKTDAPLRLLTVMSGTQLFGLDLAVIDAILPRGTQIAPVPLAGRKVAGLVNVRGHIVTLLDIRSCLGLAGDDLARMNVTINKGNEIYGLLFDSVGDIVDVNRADMEPVPAILDERWHGMAGGIFRQPANLLILLDVEKIIDAAQPAEDER